jgi:type IV pilus assembly protein PilY1
MKPKKLLLLIIPFLFLLFPMVSFAKDTDIYMASGEGVEPNILILFDNSRSMRLDSIETSTYDPNHVYPASPGCPADGTVYRYQTTYPRGWVWFKNSISDVGCSTAQSQLSLTGQYTGNTRSGCNRDYYQLQTANRRNYEASPLYELKTKIRIAKDVIEELLDEDTGVSGVRVGLMLFNDIATDTTYHGWGNHENAHGGYIPEDCEVKSLTSSYRTSLSNAIEAIYPDTYTPLAESLYEAGIYFKGGVNPPNDHHSYFNPSTTYASPIQYSCQKNYVIIMTDGDPTRDDGYRPGDSCTGQGTDAEAHHHVLWNVIGDQPTGTPPAQDGFEPGGANRKHYLVSESDMGGTDYLDDVAKYFYTTDLRPDLTGTQNITTYTIGFAVTPQYELLNRTAAAGGGEYYTANNTAELKTAFQHAIGRIKETCSSFVAPIVPVSRMEKETAGDKLYLALFQPNNDVMWSGNIKRFGVVQSGVNIGQIIDYHNVPALDDNGQILDSATSHWPTDEGDGPDVEFGGVGAKLKNRATARNINTFQGTQTGLTHDSNAFDTTHITAAMLGVVTDEERNNVVNYVYGFDAYDDDHDGDTAEKRKWLLGSFLHSRPFIIHYPKYSNPDQSKSYVFAGSNGGMLHAFDDSDGSEAWAFIPPNLLSNLKALRADVNAVFVDGSPKAYIEHDSHGDVQKAILIFGERRGGNRYYALDVTTPTSPTFLWEISPDGRRYLTNPIDSAADYLKMGQTWSAPTIGKVACQEGASHCVNVSPTTHIGERWMAFIGGGYDANQDNNPVVADDTVGMAVYVVDVLDGSMVKRFSITEYPAGSTYQMTYSIPSDVSKVDTDGDGKVDRLYVGDLGGQMWRFDIADPNPLNWTGRIILESNPGCSPDTTSGRKIFYPPDVTLELGNYEMLLFGTGDREHPDEENIENRIYAVKDKSSIETMPILNECNLFNVTSGELQAPTTTQERKNEILSELNEAYGWFIILGAAEKSLSAPVVFFKTAYFTTFSPLESDDPCQAGFGTARMYALSYTTGNAVFNLDGSLDNVISGTDRSEVIGTAIPSGVIITFIGGTAVAYTGVGGGVDSPKLSSTKSLVPVNWRIVF